MILSLPTFKRPGSTSCGRLGSCLGKIRYAPELTVLKTCHLAEFDSSSRDDVGVCVVTTIFARVSYS